MVQRYPGQKLGFRPTYGSLWRGLSTSATQTPAQYEHKNNENLQGSPDFPQKTIHALAILPLKRAYSSSRSAASSSEPRYSCSKLSMSSTDTCSKITAQAQLSGFLPVCYAERVPCGRLPCSTGTGCQTARPPGPQSPPGCPYHRTPFACKSTALREQVSPSSSSSRG